MLQRKLYQSPFLAQTSVWLVMSGDETEKMRHLENNENYIVVPMYPCTPNLCAVDRISDPGEIMINRFLYLAKLERITQAL